MPMVTVRISDEDKKCEAYDLAARCPAHPHDAVFVALASTAGLELGTFDRNQIHIRELGRARGVSEGSGDVGGGTRG